MTRAKRGFLLGKFLPPHRGHLLLCHFAQAQVEELVVLVCSLPDEPMRGALRYAWMRELLPEARVLWCDDILPQAPSEDPERFWSLWREAILRRLPAPIDLVFASETYGHRLAQELGAEFVPCDTARRGAPISGAAIRADPFAHWAYLPECVRQYYAKRVCLFGPESSGKSTLAAALAEHYRTVLAPEYGRTYTDHFGVALNASDLEKIARGQAALTHASKRFANRVLVEDTDPVMTAVWSDMLLGQRSAWFAAFQDHADLYLLCDIDFPWADDGTRYFADSQARERFFSLCRDELDRRRLNYVVVSGSREARLAQAIAATEILLGPAS